MTDHAATVPSSRRLLGAVLAVASLAAVALTAFTWPAANLEPRGLDLGIAGPAPAAAQLEQGLGRTGAFDLHRYAREDEARDAIERREVYGALVPRAGGAPKLLTASAASPIVAQLLPQALGEAGARPPEVVDVVPADSDDPRGAAFSSLLLPLTLLGTLTGLIFTVAARPGALQAGGIAGAALVVGVVAAAIVQGWLGVLGGDWWLNAAVLALLVLAVASLVAGATAVLGLAGLGVAALLLVFVGNPFSAVSTAPDLLPGFAAVTGQLLPPGAGGTLLRSTAFFDGHGATGALLVLLAWSAAGLTAIWIGARRGGGADLAAHPVAGLAGGRAE